LSYRDPGQEPSYDDQNLLLPAAIGGVGVALARASLVESDLQSGRPVQLFSQSVRARYSYFIVYPPGSENTAKIQVFKKWLLEQVRSGKRKHAIDVRAGKSAAGRTLRLVRRRGL
jgi:LysR family glycine cleavage system transcriptional activator